MAEKEAAAEVASGPTGQAAEREAEGQPAAARTSLPALPGDILLRLIEPLDVRDRRSLAACCSELRAAAWRPGHAWWRCVRATGVGHQARPASASMVASVPNTLKRRSLPIQLELAQFADWLVKRGPALRSLAIRRSASVTLPPAMSRLTALTSLDVSGSLQLKQGLHHLAHLPIRELILSGCGFTALPAALSRLSSLTSLHAGGGMRLLTGLRHVSDSLKQLSIRGCGLQGLPHTLSMLTALTSLDASTCKRLCRGLQHLQRLPNLRCLDISETAFTALPPAVGGFTALVSLDISANPQLTTGFEHLAGLEKLTLLNMRWCGSTTAPAALASRPRLRVFTGESLV